MIIPGNLLCNSHQTLKLLADQLFSEVVIFLHEVFQNPRVHGQTFIASDSIIPEFAILDLFFIKFKDLSHPVIVHLHFSQRSNECLERVHQQSAVDSLYIQTFKWLIKYHVQVYWIRTVVAIDKVTPLNGVLLHHLLNKELVWHFFNAVQWKETVFSRQEKLLAIETVLLSKGLKDRTQDSLGALATMEMISFYMIDATA